MHPFEIRVFDSVNVDQLSFAPESDFKKLVIERIGAKVNLFPWISVEFELHMIYRNSSVRVYGSIRSKAEDIFGRLEGGRDFEFSEERLFLL